MLMLIAIRHAEQSHKLEQERERYAQEWQAGQAQLQALQKALEEHQLLLADKVQENRMAIGVIYNIIDL
jgi:Skp family chaperone for outer membrane proteins